MVLSDLPLLIHLLLKHGNANNIVSKRGNVDEFDVLQLTTGACLVCVFVVLICIKIMYEIRFIFVFIYLNAQVIENNNHYLFKLYADRNHILFEFGNRQDQSFQCLTTMSTMS